MTNGDRQKGAATLRAVLAALLTSGADGAGQEGADLRRLVGALQASATDRVEASDFGPQLRACFQAATAAGATFNGMDRARQAAASVETDRIAVQRVAQTCIRFALVEMCLILSVTTFVSRQDTDAALGQVNATFEAAEEFAADQRNAAVYRALVTLHAATARDLTQRSRLLPRVVPFAFANRMPALTLANRLYGDGSRYQELTAENRVVHPLFSPSSGRALAS